MPSVLGVVPLIVDGHIVDELTADGLTAEGRGRRDAPVRRDVPALQPLAGRTPLARAVDAMRDAGVVDRVLVTAPQALLDGVHAPSLRAVQNADVLATPGPDLLDAVAAVLAHRASADAGIVVIYDPLYPFGGAELTRAVLAALRDDPDCAVALAVRPVTDTLKWVDPDGDVRGTEDRAALRVPLTPVGVRRAALARLLTEAVPSPCVVAVHDLALLVRNRGGRLVGVPGPPDAFRVETPSEWLLAEAIL